MRREEHADDSLLDDFRELTKRQMQQRGGDFYCFPSEECRRELFRWFLDHGESDQIRTRFYDGILVICEIEVLRRLALANVSAPGPVGREVGDAHP